MGECSDNTLPLLGVGQSDVAVEVVAVCGDDNGHAVRVHPLLWAGSPLGSSFDSVGSCGNAELRDCGAINLLHGLVRLRKLPSPRAHIPVLVDVVVLLLKLFVRWELGHVGFRDILPDQLRRLRIG